MTTNAWTSYTCPNCNSACQINCSGDGDTWHTYIDCHACGEPLCLRIDKNTKKKVKPPKRVGKDDLPNYIKGKDKNSSQGSHLIADDASVNDKKSKK